jgi:hypothetical protein
VIPVGYYIPLPRQIEEGDAQDLRKTDALPNT